MYISYVIKNLYTMYTFIIDLDYTFDDNTTSFEFNQLIVDLNKNGLMIVEIHDNMRDVDVSISVGCNDVEVLKKYLVDHYGILQEDVMNYIDEYMTIH